MYIIENKGIMDHFYVVMIKQLQEIITGLSKKKGTEEEITNDILNARERNI